MSKGLESFENIIREGDFRYLSSLYDRDELNEDIETVEKELKEYKEIKDIAKHYNWDDITSEIFNIKTDKKYRDLFNSAIVNIQEDYRKARALEIIKRFSHYDIHFLNYLLSEEKIAKEEYDLLKEVLL